MNRQTIATYSVRASKCMNSVAQMIQNCDDVKQIDDSLTVVRACIGIIESMIHPTEIKTFEDEITVELGNESDEH